MNSGFRVSFFFFISGFVMCLVYAPQVGTLTAKDFFFKRFTRIFPVYWLAFALTLLLVLTMKGSSPKGLSIILNTFGLQSCNPGYVLDLNYPTWSISVELFFYALFPFLLRWMTNQNANRVLIVAAILWVLQSAQHMALVEMFPNPGKKMEEFTNAFPLWHFCTFISGMSIARWIHAGAVPVWIQKNATLLFILSVITFGILVYVPNIVLKYMHNGLLSPLFAITLLSLYYDTSFVSRSLSGRYSQQLGDLSFGLFIFQYPVWLICAHLASPGFFKTGWYFLSYFLVLLIVSFFSNRYFEKPILNRLRRNQ